MVASSPSPPFSACLSVNYQANNDDDTRFLNRMLWHVHEPITHTHKHKHTERPAHSNCLVLNKRQASTTCNNSTGVCTCGSCKWNKIICSVCVLGAWPLAWSHCHTTISSLELDGLVGNSTDDVVGWSSVGVPKNSPIACGKYLMLYIRCAAAAAAVVVSYMADRCVVHISAVSYGFAVFAVVHWATLYNFHTKLPAAYSHWLIVKSNKNALCVCVGVWCTVLNEIIIDYRSSYTHRIFCVVQY